MAAVAFAAAIASLVATAGLAQAKPNPPRKASAKTYTPRFHEINGLSLTGNDGLALVYAWPSSELLYGSKPYSPTLLVPPNCPNGFDGGETGRLGTAAVLYACSSSPPTSSSFETYNTATKTWTSADATAEEVVPGLVEL